jgi:3-hydroxyacyl-CoA dehydrogenase
LDELARSVPHPERVLGLHFFNPAQVMRLLEVVKAGSTTDDTLATGLALARRMGKQAVVAGVGYGFIGNRIYAAYRRQCEFMIEDGAWPEQIDAALTGFGYAMGLFATGDMSGLDIPWAVRKAQAATRDPAHRYVAIADRLCEAGRLGRKTGKGWYAYPQSGGRGVPDPEVRALIEAESVAKGIVRREFTADEIVRRVLATMVNEAALLIEEGVARQPGDVDVVFVHGYGFPRHEGGPLFWASRQDRRLLRDALDAVEAATGPGFQRGDIDAMLARI